MGKPAAGVERKKVQVDKGENAFGGTHPYLGDH